MAADDGPGRRLGTLLVASLTVLLPLSALAWSVAQVAPPLSAPPARVVVIEPSVPTIASVGGPATALAADVATDGIAMASASIEAAIDVGAAEAAPIAAPVVAAPSIVIPAATIVAAPPVPLPTATPTPRVEAWTGEASFNFVALGVDRRADGELTRTDTLMIGNIDTVRRRLTILSVPRDLVVDIPGYGRDRINTAYVYGEQFKEPDGGIGLVKRTIERNFGIPIEHYGLIDFNCFRTTVDAVGGVTVDVPREIDDPYYPTEDYGYKPVHFDVGPQRMDGERALEYARTRNADNDFHRIRRQQLIASALRTELLSLRSLPAVPAILGGCRNMHTDLGWRDYLALASVVRNLRDGDIAFHAIDEQMVVGTTLATGASVLLPRWEPIRALIRESFEGPRRPTTADIPAESAPAASVDAPDGAASVAGQARRDGVVGAPIVSVPVVGAPAFGVPATN